VVDVYHDLLKNATQKGAISTKLAVIKIETFSESVHIVKTQIKTTKYK